MDGSSWVLLAFASKHREVSLRQLDIDRSTWVLVVISYPRVAAWLGRQLAVSLFGNMIGKMRNTYEHQRVRRLPWPLWSGCETLNWPQISEKWLKWTFFWQISSPMHLNLLLDGSHGLWVLRGGVGSGFLLKLRDFLNYEFQGSICFEFISYFSTSASKICCHHCYIAMLWTALSGWWMPIPIVRKGKRE